MNKKMILSVALFSMFSNVGAMNKQYSCPLGDTSGKSRGNILVRTVENSTGARACWFSTDDKFHTKDQSAVVLNSDSNDPKSVIAIEGECLWGLMKAIATRSVGCIETSLAGRKSKIWTFEKDTKALSRAAQYFTHQLNNSLKAANEKNVSKVDIAGSGERIDGIRAELQVPYSFNPFGSFGIKIAANDKAKNTEVNLSIDNAAAKNLLYHAMLIKRVNSSHNDIFISYTEKENESEKIARLDIQTTKKQIQSHSFKQLWIKRCLGGLSFAGFVALLAYFQFNRK